MTAMHCTGAIAPRVVVFRPFGHAVQFASEVAPGVGKTVSKGHSMASPSGQTLPEGQGEQRAATAALVNPLAHAAQAEAPACDAYPLPHCAHTDDDVAATTPLAVSHLQP